MRKLPQLSLRDLFWLVALVAMGCGWVAHHFSVSREHARQRAQWERALDEARNDANRALNQAEKARLEAQVAKDVLNDYRQSGK